MCLVNVTAFLTPIPDKDPTSEVSFLFVLLDILKNEKPESRHKQKKNGILSRMESNPLNLSNLTFND